MARGMIFVLVDKEVFFMSFLCVAIFIKNIRCQGMDNQFDGRFFFSSVINKIKEKIG